jgi:hypothetical protein
LNPAVADLLRQPPLDLLGGIDVGAHGAEFELEARLALAHARQSDAHLVQAARRLLVLGLDLRLLDVKGVEVTRQSLRLAHGRLEVLVTGEAHRLLALHRGGEAALADAQGAELRLQRLQACARALGLGARSRDLFPQLADGALAAKDGVVLRLAVAVAPAAGEPAVRVEHLAHGGDIGGDHPVTPPEPLGLVQMVHHSDMAEEIAQQTRPGPGDEPRCPAHVGGILRRGAIAGKGLQGQEGRRTRPFTLEKTQSGPRMLEPLHHHPLQALAEDAFHRRLETGGHLEQIGHRAHHARDPGARGEDGAHAGAIAFPVALELLEALELAFLRGQRQP